MRKGEVASSDSVLHLFPDTVIVATGAAFCREGRSGLVDRAIPGADKPFVYTPEDVLKHGVRPIGKVVVLDGEGTHASAGVAELLARSGAEVTMISSSFAPFSSRLAYAFEGELVAKRLADANVTFRAATWMREIGDRELRAFDVNSERESTLTDVDGVVPITGRHSIDGLARELESKVAQLFTIGDALAVRPFAAAAFEGQKFARLVGEPGAPASIG